MVALVDDEDYERFGHLKWYAAKNYSGYTWYAQRIVGPRGARKTIQLHRQIMGCPEGEVDHKNGDGLDCRRDNMRLATTSGNRRNVPRRKTSSSPYKGVSFQAGKWRARISVGPRGAAQKISLGMFNSPEDAAAAYDAMAKKLSGEFAWINLPADTAQ